MRDYFKPKTWLITTLMLMMAFSLSSAIVYYEFGLKKNIKIIRASVNDNVSGWAWNSNIGWISFNCTGDNPACGASNYGVSVDLNTGNFSGYAWSSGVGWISFNEINPPDSYAFNASCVTVGSCSGLNNCTACYNFSNKNVYGWAKILSLGDNGWIKFSGNKQNGQPWAPGVAIDSITGNVSGWAWNANDNGSGIGWISFNCSDVPKSCKGGTNPGVPCPNGNECLGGGSCVDNCTALSNYKVVTNINRPPTVAGMTAPNWSYSQAAQSGALNAYLNWTFNDQDAGSSESAYQIIVNTTNSVVNPIFDSGSCTIRNTPKCQVDASAVQFPLHSGLDPAMSLNYDTAYYWWIKVWDNKGAESAWTQFNTNISGHDLTDNQVGNTAKNPINPNLTFTTYKHEMPDVNFTWSPFSPSKGEEAKLTDASKIFFSAPPPENPTTAVLCTSATCRWEWSTTANAEIVSPTASSTVIKFNSAGNATVTLKVTDSDNYYSLNSKVINVNVKLPGWKEVKPE